MGRIVKNIIVLLYFKFFKNIKLGRGVRLSLNNFFSGYNAVFNNSEVSNCFIGKFTYVANNSIIKRAKIGAFTAIGDNVRTMLGIHPSEKIVTIHPAFFSLNRQCGITFVEKQLFQEHKYIDKNKKYVVEIGNDVWIGNNVNIMDGIKIGDGAIIATGAVVTKDVEPYSIVGGIPAKHIRYRFTDEQIKFLLKVKWWDKDISWLKENVDYFTDIRNFCNLDDDFFR